MPAVARKGDQFKTGHAGRGDAVSSLTSPSTDVFVNGRGVERKGDLSVSHTIKIGKRYYRHIVNILGGSSTVYVNGKPIARIGDPIDQGSISSGSGDVFSG